MIKKSEGLIQQECYMWFNNNFPELRKLLFHVDNNSFNGRIGKEKSSMGVVPGVSDLIFIYGGTCHCIEMKTPKGYQSDDQIEFQNKVEGQGVDYYICRSLDDFKSLINKIIEWKQ